MTQLDPQAAPLPEVSAPVRSDRRRWRPTGALLIYLGIVAACVFALLPMAWGLITSLKPETEVATSPPSWIPNSPTLEHYQSVLQSQFPFYLGNSVIVAALTIVLSLLLASHAAYAFARFRFRFRAIILWTIIASMMVARLANIVPLYIIGAQLGLLDTHLILVLVYSGWQMPMAVWLLMDFFKNVPESLDRAARIDGYGLAGTFYKVAFPLVRPGLSAAAVVVFMFVWNDFILALTLTSSASTRMGTVGLYNYVGQFGIEWGELMAAVMIALLPVALVFAIIQKSFISGLTSGAVKG